MNYCREKKGFVSILGLMIAVCIIFYICYIALKSNTKNSTLEHIAEDSQSNQKIDTTNYRSVLESSKTAIEEYNKQALERERQIEELGKHF